jgi:acetyl esterase/lipase
MQHLMPPSLANFSTMSAKLDFTHYGRPCGEWKRFAATHPAAADPNRFPSDDTSSTTETPPLPQGAPEAAARGLARSVGQKNDAHVEEKTIRADPDSPLTALVYTKVLNDDDLKLDNPLPCVVYFHSGGYGLLGGPDTERYFCSQMAARLRVVVVHICYRQTPPHRHPDPHDDGRDGLNWVVDSAEELGIDTEQIVLVGMCFGAGLAASVCLQACAERREVRLKGMLLGFPWLFQEEMFPYDNFVSRGATSRYQCAAAPMMSKRVYDDLQQHLGITDQKDPVLNVPLADDRDLARLPRTAFILAGMDLLRDDGILFAEKLRALG